MAKLKKMDYSGDGLIYEVEPGKVYKLVLSMGRDPKTGKYPRRTEKFLGTYKQAVKRMEAMHVERDLIEEIRGLGLDFDELAQYGLGEDAIFTRRLSAREVRDELERMKAERAARDALEREKTFSEWCELYLSTREAIGQKRENTYKQDRAISRHLLPYLGDMRLSEIKPSTISAMYADMKLCGVGASTVRHCHRLLKTVMHAALMDELINRNPVELVEPPKKPKAKRRALTAQQAARVRDLTSTEDATANEIAVFLGLSLGARVGEVLGLQWQHVELDGERPHVHIVQQLLDGGKTGPCKTDDDDAPIGRVVPLDSLTVAVLRSWRSRQNSALNSIGIGSGRNTPVVTNEVGTWSDRRNFSAWFRSWCVANGFGKWVSDDGRQVVDLTFGLDDAELYPTDDYVVEWRDIEGWPCDESGRRFSRTHKREHPKAKRHYDGLVFHELRHTHFTIRLSSGTSIPVAQALGGWSTPAMLMETYVHSTPDGIWSESGFMDELLTTVK